MPDVTRVFLTEDPYIARSAALDWNRQGIWPCKWVTCVGAQQTPFVCAFRLPFTLETETVIRVHVTADERYELFLDGVRVARGSERGDRDHWYFETYDLALGAGTHMLVARVWALGEQAAFAQMTVAPGFLLSPQEEAHIALLGTGVAAWEAKVLGGYTFTDPIIAWGTGANIIIDGKTFDWDFERGAGDGWLPAATGRDGADALRINDYWPTHLLRPATLPPMLDEPRHIGKVRLVAALPVDGPLETHSIPIHDADNLPDEAEVWQRLIDGLDPLELPAHARRRVLIDLENYVCAYPELVVSSGEAGVIRVNWQESLYEDARKSVKGNRDEIEGKHFVCVWHIKDGVGDTFLLDGGEHCRYETLWWQCGRYVEIVIETAEQPLTIENFTLRETRYPLEPESRFEASDPQLNAVIPLATRALQMCSHETYMDCPYFEQLMYVGDTRLQALLTYTLTRDDRLPRKALRMFDASRLPNGLTQSRYPTRVFQIIPPFSLWYVAMLHDYALWRGDLDFIHTLLPGARGVVDHFLARRNAEGLVVAAHGWNCWDWVPAWDSGVPPDGADGVSGLQNWQLALVLSQMAELEAAVGEPEMALRAHRLAEDLAAAIQHAFWDEERGLFADDRAHSRWSEHSQCLAILSGQLPPEQQDRVAQGLLSAPDLERTTIYFTHYLFETFTKIGRPDALLKRLELWYELETLGLKTTVEMPEPTRSDCHAWGAHPVYHYFASLLGIRPASFGFETVRIAPQLGTLTHAKGVLAHPKGDIEVGLHLEESGLVGHVILPEGLTGEFHYAGEQLSLQAGRQEIDLRDLPLESLE
jgi:alpha-L-rhamnosidase